MNTCLFNSTTKCKHEACFESQEIACCYACKYTKCSSRCKKGTRTEGEIPEEEWEKIIKMQEETNGRY